MTAKTIVSLGNDHCWSCGRVLMYRRGESVRAIAVRAVTNPVGSLVSELEVAAS